MGGGVIQAAAQDSADHGAGEGERDAFANSKSSAGPASVEQPDPGVMFFQLTGQ